MKLQQLRIIRETARCNFNLTEAANALLTSQSGVSKHVKDFEDELGVELFVRRGKRLLGLTEAGKEAVEIVERMLIDAQNLTQIGGRLSSADEGTLRIVTTHTQARYTLPPIIAHFSRLSRMFVWRSIRRARATSPHSAGGRYRYRPRHRHDGKHDRPRDFPLFHLGACCHRSRRPSP